MGLKDRTLSTIKNRRDNVLKGEINCIPFPFSNFRDDVPGIEQSRYYLVTGATKSAKTQFGNFTFIYYPLLYAMAHPDKLNIKIFYYALEETPEQVMTKFASYILYTLSKGKYRVSPTDLNSTNNDKPLNDEIMQTLLSTSYQDILKFFEDHIEFPEALNPTGVLLHCKEYATNHGTIKYKNYETTDDFGEKHIAKAFDCYEQDDPKEYRIIFYDHIGLTPTEKGMTLRDSISKLSEHLVYLRNRYHYIPVVIQQQAMFETLDAYKMNKLEPTIANLADNKATSRDVDVAFGIFSPYKYNIPTYTKGGESYDITTFKDNIRFMECLINRHGLSNGVIPLFFDGACNYFNQLPKPSETVKMQRIVQHLNKIRGNTTGIMFFRLTLNNFIKWQK